MKIRYPVETALFLLLLALFNLPGLFAPSAVALFPSALFRGELWRWVTYPWAHISLYHLALDAAAFLALYNQLRGAASERLFHLASCIFFSGLLPILFEPRLDLIGLRGLSGVAHGLMLVTAFDSLSSDMKPARNFALLICAGLVTKCIIEQLTGSILFGGYHLGNVGLPVPSCHSGGILGGLLSSLLVNRGQRVSGSARVDSVPDGPRLKIELTGTAGAQSRSGSRASLTRYDRPQFLCRPR